MTVKVESVCFSYATFECSLNIGAASAGNSHVRRCIHTRPSKPSSRERFFQSELQELL